MNAEITGARVYWESDFTLPLFGHISITETMVNAWVVMLIILGLCLFFTHNLQKIPKGKQALIEKAIEMVDGLIEQNMGKGCQSYAPYIVTLLLSSVLGSLVSLIGLRSVTADLNTTLGWAIMTFCMIIYANIRYKGLGGYLKGFLEPIPVMLPLNILSEIVTPESMSFRHFGNIAGGMVITTLLIGALSALSTALHLPIPLLQSGIPGVLSLYCDLFSGCIQAIIFSMLTMAYVGSAREA